MFGTVIDSGANQLFDGLTNQLEFDENFDEEDFAADLYALQNLAGM